MAENYANFSRFWNTAIPPNDEYFGEQWNFQTLGNHADINVQKGWERYLDRTSDGQYGNDVIVAIIDSGVNFNHPDLKDSMWKNPGESGHFNETHSKSNNGIDDDGNELIDDVYGWDFTEEDKKNEGYEPNQPMDTHGHGTFCAGIVASKPNGGGKLGAGVAGYTNGKVSLLFLDSMAYHLSSNAVEIDFFLDVGEDHGFENL